MLQGALFEVDAECQAACTQLLAYVTSCCSAAGTADSRLLATALTVGVFPT